MKSIGEWVGMFSGGAAMLNVTGSLSDYNFYGLFLVIPLLFAACLAGGVIGILLQEITEIIYIGWKNGKAKHTNLQH